MRSVKNVIDQDLFTRRAREALTRKGMTQEELALEIEATTGSRPGQSTVSNWMRGLKMPSSRYLPALVEILGLTWADLGIAASGASSRRTQAQTGDGAAQPLRPEDVDLSRIVLIPRMGRAAAGDGAENGLVDTPEWEAFTREEVGRLTGVSPDQLRSIKVAGDSMEPDLRSGDTVVYQPTTEVADFGVYVVAFDELVVIKKVQRFGGGALEIISTNPAYRSELLKPLPEADTPSTYRSDVTGATCTCRVVGKVVFYLRPV